MLDTVREALEIYKKCGYHVIAEQEGKIVFQKNFAVMRHNSSFVSIYFWKLKNECSF